MATANTQLSALRRKNVASLTNQRFIWQYPPLQNGQRLLFEVDFVTKLLIARLGKYLGPTTVRFSPRENHAFLRMEYKMGYF